MHDHLQVVPPLPQADDSEWQPRVHLSVAQHPSGRTTCECLYIVVGVLLVMGGLILFLAVAEAQGGGVCARQLAPEACTGLWVIVGLLLLLLLVTTRGCVSACVRNNNNNNHDKNITNDNDSLSSMEWPPNPNNDAHDSPRLFQESR
jgi:uncharacterized membrane protein YidH (DUF202 family)